MPQQVDDINALRLRDTSMSKADYYVREAEGEPAYVGIPVGGPGRMRPSACGCGCTSTVAARIKDAREALAGVDFDTMVGTGLSGSVIVPILARAMKKRYLIIRKDKDSTHSSKPAVGRLGERWLFVDDFVSSGATFIRCRETVEKLAYDADHETQFVGAYEYAARPYATRNGKGGGTYRLPESLSRYINTGWWNK